MRTSLSDHLSFTSKENVMDVPMVDKKKEKKKKRSDDKEIKQEEKPETTTKDILDEIVADNEDMKKFFGKSKLENYSGEDIPTHKTSKNKAYRTNEYTNNELALGNDGKENDNENKGKIWSFSMAFNIDRKLPLLGGLKKGTIFRNFRVQPYKLDGADRHVEPTPISMKDFKGPLGFDPLDYSPEDFIG